MAMSEPPFGFGLPEQPGDPERGGEGGSGGSGSGGQGGGAGGPGGPLGPGGLFGDPQQLAEALRQVADLMSYQGGPVNWDLAKNAARQAIAAHGDPSVLDNQRAAVVEAVRLADLWLEDATWMPSGIRSIQAWSRSEWVEATMPVWKSLFEPIAERNVDSMGSMLSVSEADLELPPEVRSLGGMGLLGGLGEMMRRIGGLMVGQQAGLAVGTLAEEIISSSDIGLPLGSEGTAARLPGAIEDYARGIKVDPESLRDVMQQLDPSSIDLANPEAINEALTGAATFHPEDTPEQKAALARIETLLALIEGWVATVVADAARNRLPEAEALAEAIRRRRATGGPAERTFATLVGLELRPRRLREAATMWRALTEARGIRGRDEIWSHPDLLPTAEDLDDPEGFVRGHPEIDLSTLTGTDAAAEDPAPPGDQAAPGDAPPQAEPPDAVTAPPEGQGPGRRPVTLQCTNRPS